MKNKSFLLLENNPDLQKIIIKSLELGNFNGEVISNMNDMLENLKTVKELDVLLIEDVLLGIKEIDFFDNLRKIERVRKVPVILFSSKMQKKDINGFGDFGVRGLISKPFDPVNLYKEIDDMIGELVSKN